MAQKIKSVLFISTQLPYPPKSGGTVKSWNYVQDLSKRYELSIACLLKDDDASHEAEFRQKIEIKTFYSEALQISRSALALIKSYFGHSCLNAYRNFSPSFKQKIETLSQSVDILLVDHYEMFQYVPKTFKGKVVMHTHNAEFMLWKRMADLSSNPIKKLVLLQESKRVAKFEQQIFDCSHLVYTTDSDRELYIKNAFNVGNVSTTYHLGNDHLLELPKLNFEETELAITFMGTLSWEPNVDGLLWFVESVWPLLKDKYPDLKFYVLGKNPDPRIIKACKAERNIIFTGFVQDLDSYLKKTRVYIAPLRFGSGMKVKVLEGLYRGVPTVSTFVGVEGLEIEDEHHIMVADQADLFFEKCCQLLENQALWDSMNEASRKVSSEKYRWQPLFDRMDQALKSLV